MSVVSPLTDRLSSTVVVPPAESIVRLPEVVSISLPLILTLSTVATSLTARTARLVIPVTVKSSLTLTFPAFESRCNSPVAVSIVLLVKPGAILTLPIVALSFASTAPVNVVTPETTTLVRLDSVTLNVLTVATPMVASVAEIVVNVETPRIVAFSETFRSPITVAPIPRVSNLFTLS